MRRAGTTHHLGATPSLCELPVKIIYNPPSDSSRTSAAFVRDSESIHHDRDELRPHARAQAWRSSSTDGRWRQTLLRAMEDAPPAVL